MIHYIPKKPVKETQHSIIFYYQEVFMMALRIVFIVLLAGVFSILPLSAQSLNNYVFSATTSSFTPISGGTLPYISIGSLDDGSFDYIPIGFDFYYMGTRYSTVSMCTNGFMVLTNPGIANPGSVGATTNIPNLNTGTTRPVLAPYWRDMHMDLGTVSYTTTGAAGNRVFTAEWLKARLFTSSTVRVPFISFQVKLYEATGRIEYYYRSESGPNFNPNTPTTVVSSIGINGAVAGQFMALDGMGASPTPSYNIETPGNYLRPATNQMYQFTPVQTAVNAPTGLSFINVSSNSMTLTWQNNAANAVAYAVYRSDDGGTTYNFVATVPLGTPSYSATNLNAAKLYYWRVIALSEGVRSNALQGSQPTNGASITAATTGNWSATSTWTGGVVPTANDNVTVPSGVTVTVDNASAVANNLTVSGTVVFAATGSTTLSVMQNLTINSSGTVTTSATGTSTSHTLNIGSNQRLEGGNLTNDGILDLHTNGGSAAAALVFMGYGNASFSGSGSVTDVYTITLNKGAGAPFTSMNYALMPQLQLNTTNFTVRSTASTDASGFLTLTNGVFRISGSFSYASNVFTTAAYTINNSSGIWLDNANFTVSGQNGSPTCSGYFRVSNGTYNVGTSSGNTMQFTSSSISISGSPTATLTNAPYVNVEGGAINVTGRFQVTSGTIYYTQSGGTITTATVGNASSSSGAFDMGSSSTSCFIMTGGSIVVQNASTAATPLDFRGLPYAHPNNLGEPSSITITPNTKITGGSVMLGNANTGATAVNFRIAGIMPPTTISSTSAAHSATLFANTWVRGNLNHSGAGTMSFSTFALGVSGDYTNNAVITASSGTLVFNGEVQQNFNGSGSISSNQIATLIMQNSSGANPGLNNNYAINLTTALTLLHGSIGGSGALTLGTGSSFTTSRGSGTLANTPTFNATTYNLTYTPPFAGGDITTSNEVPAGGAIGTLTVNNATSNTILGTALNATSFTLTNGIVITTSTNLLTITGTSASNLSFTVPTSLPQIIPTYVSGPMARRISGGISAGTANTYTFPLGKGSFNAMDVINPSTSGTTSQYLTVQAEVFDANSGGSAGSGMQSINNNRYWNTSVNTGGGASFAATLPLAVRLWETSTPSNAVARSTTQGGSYTNIGGSLTTPLNVLSSAVSTPATLGYLVVGTKGSPGGAIAVGPSATYSGYAIVYPTLSAAALDVTAKYNLNSGTVIVELQSDYVSTSESYPITFGPMPSTNTTNAAIFRPASNVSSTLTIATSNSNPIIDFNNAYRVVLDGRPGGTGTNRRLTIEQQSTTVPAVRFQNDAIENTLRYCNVNGGNTTSPASGSTTTGIILFSTTSNLQGNNNNTVANCLIREASTTAFNPACGIYSSGNTTAGRDNKANSIINNEIANVFNAAAATNAFIYISSGNSDWTISGNSLYMPSTVPGGGASPRVFTATNSSFGILISNTSGNGFTVTNNFIGGSQAQCGGAPWAIGSVAQTTSTPTNTASVFAACSLAVGTSSNTTFQGNKIANIAYASTSALTWSGLLFTSGNLNALNNTIGGATSVTSSDTIATASGATTVTMFGIQHAGGTTTVYSNNTINALRAYEYVANTVCILRAISVTSGSNNFVLGNTIGSSNSALGLLAVANPSSSSITADVTGILQTSSTNFYAQNNTISNLTYQVPSGLTTTTVIQTRGISASSGFLTITGNTVTNLVNSALNNNTANSSPTSAAVLGISATSTSSSTTPGTLHVVTQNTVSNLSATSTVAGSQNVIGLNIGSLNSISPYNVSRNLVHSLSGSTQATTTTPNIVGINIAGGSHQVPNYHVVSNNMVRLGLDANGANISNNLHFHGIWKSSTGSSCTTTVAHNTVYIGGSMTSTVSGTGNSYAFRRQTSTTAINDTVVNNVFVNVRSTAGGSTGTGNYFAVALSQTASAGRMAGLTMNNNCLYATAGPLAQSGATNYASMLLWRGAGDVDLNSTNADPNFINATGTAAQLNLRPQNPTPIERGGTVVSSVTTDYDNNLRANLSPVDIGASAGTFSLAADVIPPLISYTSLSSPVTSTTQRSITVSVTDASGVPTSGVGLPRLYWKIRYNGTVNSVAGTFVGGGQYSFNLGSGVTGGDTVYYYVAAQDNAATPNVGLSTWNGVSTVSANPPAPGSEPTRTFQSFYAITSTCLSGNYTVGTGGNYTTLSSALSAMTSGVICGDVTLTIISNLTENGSPSLTYMNYGGAATPYKITIRPDPNGTTPFSITSTSGSYLTLFNGARNVTINGRMGAIRQGLIFENTNTNGWVFYFLNDASGDTIRNCVIKGAYANAGIGSIYIASTSASTASWGGSYGGVTGNDNIMIDSCDILNAGTGTTLPMTAIYSSGSTSTPQQANSGIVISNNNIYNFFHAANSQSTAIHATSGSVGWTISGNNIYQTAARTHTSAIPYYGIFINNSFNGNGFTITNNNIGGGAPGCAGVAWTDSASTVSHNFIGIQYTGDNTASSTISGNKISNIRINSSHSSASSTGMFTGIYISSGNATVQNNIVGGNNASDTISCSQTTTASSTTWVNGIYSTSSGTVNISGNTIGGNKANTITALSSFTSGGFSVSGINLQGSNNVNITNNTIGSSSTANAIAVNNSTAAASTQQLTGIWNQQSGSILISNNTIANLANNATTSLTQVRGIVTTSGINTISGNTVNNLTTTSTSTSTATSSAVLGIDMSSSTVGSAAQVVSNNTIHSLSSTTTSSVAVNVVGINYSFSVTAATAPVVSHLVTGNIIHSLSMASANTSTSANIIGIHYAAGNNLTIANNMIRLGINADGSNFTSGCTLTGIWKNNVVYTATYNGVILPMFTRIFHNSVYIGGSGVAGVSSPGALNTFAFRRNGTTYFAGAIDSVYNNIFMNARSNSDASQTVRHWAEYYDDVQNLNQDYNVLLANGTGGGLIARGLSLVVPTEYATIDSWRIVSGQDAHSNSTNPNFANPTGNSSAVSLQISASGSTPIESGGIALTSITTDQKGSNRASNTPTDIGADAGNFTANDLTPPTISYLPLSSPVNTTTARTLTVSITDASGVPTSGAGLPRLYWRAGTSGAFTAVTGTSIGNGQYTFANIGSGATSGSTVYYYVVAQDNATVPNVTAMPIINAGGFSSTPPNVASAPLANSYLILGTLCGVVTVGGGGANYATLKDAFDAINNSTLTCNLRINITGNTTESQTPVLNEVNYDNGGPYTITIVPSGGARSITGTNTVAMDLSGADRVIVDGRIDGTGTPKSLTIENTSSNGIAVRLVNGAQFNTIRNCVLRGNNATGVLTTTNPGAVIVFGGTNTTVGNSDNMVSSCDIREATNGTTPWYCVNSTNTTTSPSLYNSRDTLLNNNIFNYYNSGTTGNFPAGMIINDGNADWTIDGNSLYQTSARNILLSGANIIQLRVIMANAGSGTFNIRNNFIGGSAPQCGGSAMTITAMQGASLTQVMGVQIPLTGNAVISNNKIANISFSTAATSFVFTGLTLFSGNASITGNSIGGTQTSDSIFIASAPTSVNTAGLVVGMQIQTGNNTSPVQIQNNTVANIRATNFVTVATNNPANYAMGIMGINLTSALTSGVYSITGNTIGSTTVANSIHSMNPSVSSSVQYIYGIRSTSTGTVTISNNTVANLTNAAVGSTTSTSYGSASHQTSGIYVTSGNNTISNNTVMNLSCASPQAGIGGAAAVVGIMQSPSSTVHTSAPQIVNGNTVHSLYSTATTGTPCVVGIFNWSPNGGNNSVSKNTVHSLSLASSSPQATMYGIHLNGGIATVANNAIRLGIDPSGNDITTGYSITGILKQVITIAGSVTTQVPNNMDFLHNSIYIGGSNVAENGTGQGSNTFAIQRNQPGTDIFLNNVFINRRSNSTGLGKHYAVAMDATSGNEMDYNLVQANGSGGVLYGTGIPVVNTDYTTLAAWRTATLLDVNSATGTSANLANFVNPTGNATSVNMHVQSATPIEASGVDIALTLQGTGRPYLWDGQDIDGTTRSALTPNDIGADAGNFTVADIFPPAISYVPFGNTSSTSSRTVSDVVITDASGVNVTSGTRPRLYYKRFQDANTIVDNTSATNGWKWVEANNTTSPFSFTIDYSRINGASVGVGDNIQYFVVAQDLATTPNVGINSGILSTAATSVNLSAAAMPLSGSINNYAIVNAISGTVNVGSGETYNSLTRVGGLFQALNNIGMLNGNLTVNVTSDLSEDGSFSLNQMAEEGTGGYTIRIQPADASNKNISGSFVGGLIRLNAVDRVIIDGSFNNSGRYFTISNTATTNFNGSTTFGIAALQLISQGVNTGCVSDTIRNCTISTGSNQIFSYGIYGGSVTIPASISGTGPDNDNIAIINNVISNAQVGVYMRGVAPANQLTGLNISNNQFGSSDNSTTISSRAIDIESCDAALLQGNEITNIVSPFNSTTAGIEIGQWTTNARVIRNVVCGVSNPLPIGVLTCGIHVNTTTGTSGITIANNFVSGISSYGVNALTGSNPYGIRVDGGINFNIVHNTVLMDGSFSNAGVSASAALQMTNTTSAGFIVRNNILINTMSGGTGSKCYAVYVPNTTPSFTMGTFNNNDYYVSSDNYAGFFLTDIPTVSLWQGATGQDEASVAVNPVFAGSNCRALYLGITDPLLVGSSAVSGIVNTDIDGLSRTKYYMGADEITPSFSFVSQPQSQAICVGSTITLNGTATVSFDDNISRPQMAPTYRWTKNTTTIGGATNSSYTITNAVAGDAGTYNVIAKFGANDSLTSTNAVLTIGSPVSITQQPVAPAALCAGTGGFTLTVIATGSNLSYQWQKDAQRNGTWVNISAATNSSYVVLAVTAADSGKYRCIVNGPASCTPPSVTSSEVDVVVRVPVSISGQPAPTSTLCLGNSFNLSVLATGNITSYQWQQDRLRNNTWTNIGTNSNSYAIASASSSDSGNYRVIITGPCNTLTSQTANVIVNSPATITTQPVAPAPLCAGSAFSLSVATSGTVSGIQWQKSPVGQNNFSNISGATSATYSVASAVTSDDADYRVVISGPCIASNLNSAVVRVVVNTPFNVVTQPSWSPASGCTGLSTSASVVVTGTVNSYQWQKFNGSIWVNVSGATSSNYSISSLVLSDAGDYRVQISGPCSSPVTSNVATLVVQQNVQITANPTSQTLCTGNTLNLGVTTVGTVLSYQWQYDATGGGTWANIPGATNATYSKSNIALTDAGSYRIQIVGTCSAAPVNSTAAVITVLQPFTIVTQPSWQSTPTNVGQTVTLTVGIIGSANFQWQRDQQRNGNWVDVGTNSNTYSYTVQSVADSGNFRCVLTGQCNTGSTTTNVVSVITCQPPTFTQQPQTPAPSCPGGTLTLTAAVAAQGQTVNYQWQQDAARNGTWVNVPAATNATYTKTNVQVSDDGNYRLQVTSSCTATPVLSNVVSFAVRAPISITGNPSSQTVCQGASVSFSVSASGATPSYQWFFNGVPISSGVNTTAVTPTLQLSNVTTLQAGTYKCFVSGPCSPNGIFSNDGVLTVNTTASITTQPQSISGCAGTPISLSVVANGTGLSYQWRNGTTNISGATTSSFTLSNPTPANSGSYNVVISNICGSVTSDNASLTITTPAAFTAHPTSQSVCQLPVVSMSVAINSDATSPSYQWRKDGVNISPSANATAVSATLSLANVTPAASGTYTCVVKTACQPNGIVSNAAVLNVYPPTAITTQPQSSTLCQGSALTLSAVAQGWNTSYQWRKGGNAISGATNATYSIASVQPNDAGDYDLVVNGLCSPTQVTSSVATLTVNTPVVINTVLAPRTVCAGSDISYTVSATGTNLSYQWRFNGQPITGNSSATTATLLINSVKASDAGNYDCVISGSCSPNGVATNSSLLSVNQRLSIQTQPQSQTVCEGTTVQFSTTLIGSATSYQWRFNGQPINSNGSATTPTLILPNVNSANTGVYDVNISGLCDNIASSSATLTVHQPMSIVSQPQAQRGCSGGATISTSVGITGTALAYQWQKDGVTVPGMTTATLTLVNPQTTMSGNYRCIITGSSICGTPQLTSDAVSITVGASPLITVQPQDKAVSFGSTVTVTMNATGMGFGQNNALAYYWYKGASQLTDDNRISGAATNTLTIRGIQTADIGNDYTVVVLGVCGQVTSRTFSLYVPSATITSQPQPQAKCAGSGVSFSVTATPTIPGSTLSYQWYRGTTALTDGGNVSGSTSNILSLTGVSSADAGDYTVQITIQPGGMKLTSSVATLTVNAAPQISAQPQNTEVCAGTPLTLQTTATGGTLSYQWWHDGTDISGATQANFSVASAASADAGSYRVLVRNECGSITSSTITVKVNTLPAIVTQPADQAVNNAVTVSFSVVATGTTPISYQWRKNGTDIPGATASTHTISSATLADQGEYTVVVKNGCGEVVSSKAKLSIITAVHDAEELGYKLYTSEPNPVSNEAVIRYELPTAGVVKLTLTDVSGKTIALLVNEALEAGEHRVVLRTGDWDIASGMYQVVLTTPWGYATSKQLLVIR